jgi:hypothetical protein
MELESNFFAGTSIFPPPDLFREEITPVIAQDSIGQPSNDATEEQDGEGT